MFVGVLPEYDREWPKAVVERIVTILDQVRQTVADIQTYRVSQNTVYLGYSLVLAVIIFCMLVVKAAWRS